MNIQQIIYNKLIENTGKHFLDSGFNGNRHWQKNQSKTLQDFQNESAQTYRIGFNENGKAVEIFRDLSVFHFLAGDGSNLELDAICTAFNKLNELDEEWADCEPHGVNISAWDFLEPLIDKNQIRNWNTFNSDCDLSQTLQGSNIRLFVRGTYQNYILMQIHGGADVRGGYTNAILFKCDDGIINEYLSTYEPSDELVKYELDYIETAVDCWDNKTVYEGKKLDKIKEQLRNN